VNARLPRITLPDFDYAARATERLEIRSTSDRRDPRAKAGERQRAKEKADRRAAHAAGAAPAAARPAHPPRDNRRMARLLDLSHTVTAGMVTYKGLPGPVIGDHLSVRRRAALRGRDDVPDREDRDGGQHGDVRRRPVAPLGGRGDLSELPLDRLAGREGICVAAPHARGLAVDEELLEGQEIGGGPSSSSQAGPLSGERPLTYNALRI